MSLVSEPSSRQAVFADAMLAIIAIGRHHSIVQISAEAERLLVEHPGCPVSAAELKDYLIRFAVRENVAMAVGEPGNS